MMIISSGDDHDDDDDDDKDENVIKCNNFKESICQIDHRITS